MHVPGGDAHQRGQFRGGQDGRVRIASRMKVPIVPVYIPRRKKVFARTEVLIGEPFLVEGKTHEDYVELADGVMERIYELRDGTAG